MFKDFKIFNTIVIIKYSQWGWDAQAMDKDGKTIWKKTPSDDDNDDDDDDAVVQLQIRTAHFIITH